MWLLSTRRPSRAISRVTMLLQKTGLRIKQFISHRKSQSNVEESEGTFPIEDKSRKRQSKTKSWLSQTRVTSEGFLLRRKASTKTAQKSPHSPPPLPTSRTAHSSASSLCSCCDAGNVSPQHSPSKNGPLHISTKILYLNSENSSPCGGDATRWRQIFPETPTWSSALIAEKQATRQTTLLESTMDLLEALSIQPVEGRKSPQKRTITRELV